jgi:hypothetical protein
MSFVAGGITEPSGGATAMIGATDCAPKVGGTACGCPNMLPPLEGAEKLNNPDWSGGLAPNVVEPNDPNPAGAGAPNTGGADAGRLPNGPNPPGAAVLPNPVVTGAPTKGM